MSNQIYIDINDINVKQKEENNSKKRILKAINLIDDFVTKFVSKIEYYKLTLESQINQPQLTLINSPLSINNNKNTQIENKTSIEKEKKEENNYLNIENNNNKLNSDDEYLDKFISTKAFYKRALYLLYLITEDKSQIEKIIKTGINSDKISLNKTKNEFSCIKEINTKNFVNHISFIKSQDLIALGMYNFFDGSSIDLYSLDLKIKLSIKKLGSSLYELQSGDLVTCSYNTINILRLEKNEQDIKYKILQTLKGKNDSGEILGVIEFNSLIISYDWNHIIIWSQNKNTNNKKKIEKMIKYKEYKFSNFGSDHLLSLNNTEFISHEKGNIIGFNTLQNFNNQNRTKIKGISSIGDSMCLINEFNLLIVGGNENGLLFIITLEEKEIINTIKINDISNYSINKILFYKNKDRFNILCSGGYNTSDKNITSDLFNITFNINKESNQLFHIEKKDVIKNLHDSWITGLLIKNYNEYKNKSNIFDNFFTESNILNENFILFSTSHDKKIKIWKYKNSNF